MAGKTKIFDFENNLTKLEGLVKEMEKGNLSLDKSLKAFEEGIGIVRNCQKALAEAEQKVEILTAGTADSSIPTPEEESE